MALSEQTRSETLWESPPNPSVQKNIDWRWGEWNGNKRNVNPYASRNVKQRKLMGDYGHTFPNLPASRVGWVDATYDDYSGDPPYGRVARNRAYAKLVKKVNGETASIGETFAEWKEAQGMAANRLFQLVRAGKRLRRGDLNGFLRELGLGRPKRRHRNYTVREVSERSAQLWLEYWFGWSPLLGDIHSAITVCSQNPPSSREAGHSADIYRYNTSSQYGREVTVAKIIWHTGATFVISNPNLYLLSQLGLANPASVAWAVLPGSFIVDWLTKTQQYFDSWTDFLGLSVIDPWRTSELHFSGWVQGRQTPWHDWDQGVTFWFEGHLCKRHRGLITPYPTTQIIANMGTSTTRAATAASLATLFFSDFLFGAVEP